MKVRLVLRIAVLYKNVYLIFGLNSFIFIAMVFCCNGYWLLNILIYTL